MWRCPAAEESSGDWAHTQTSEYSHIPRHICNAGACSDPAVLWTFPDVVCPPINTPLPNSSFCTAPLARVYIIPCWALRLLNGARCVISSLWLFDPFIHCTRPRPRTRPRTLPCSCFTLASVKLCPNRTRRRAINHGPISGSNGPISVRTRASADQKQHRS